MLTLTTTLGIYWLTQLTVGCMTWCDVVCPPHCWDATTSSASPSQITILHVNGRLAVTAEEQPVVLLCCDNNQKYFPVLHSWRKDNQLRKVGRECPTWVECLWQSLGYQNGLVGSSGLCCCCSSSHSSCGFISTTLDNLCTWKCSKFLSTGEFHDDVDCCSKFKSD